MQRRHIVTGWLVIAVLLALALAACGSDDDTSDQNGFIHIEEGLAETQFAQTAVAVESQRPTETPGPTLTPSVTPEPYILPTDPPDLDNDLAITRVGDEEITLGEYRKRVRFDRYRLLYPVVKLAEKYGTEQLFDLTKEDNWYVSSLFATLADSYSLGAQSHRVMVIEEIAMQEAQRRGLEVDPFRFDANMAEWLGLQVGDGAQLPPEFQARYDEFIAGIDTYANMSEEEFRRIIRAQTLYDQLKFLIQQELDLNASQETTVGVAMEDIIVQGEAEAQVIAQRLTEGEALRDIALDLGYTPASEDTARVLRIGDENLPRELLNVIFDADQGAIIGPVRIEQGWYVGKVGSQVLDVLQPADIDVLREEYFLDWIEAHMDDPDMVEDYDNWILETPQEPLPRDVSPLMRDENITLPQGTGDPLESSLFPGVNDTVDAPDDGTDDSAPDDSAPDDSAPDDSAPDDSAGSGDAGTDGE